ncbi:hypothetical protein HYW75_00800, partial [Candidatus Pacearchaeota archaeon]|nr:hypothetical protein [Candidatus Pacearchaeota archaeon]
MSKRKKRNINNQRGKKREDVSFSHIVLFLSMILFGIFSIAVVQGFDIVKIFQGATDQGRNLPGSILEDANFVINISINSTNFTNPTGNTNITNFSISLPSGFSYLNFTIALNTTVNYSITNTSNLIVVNATDNGTALVVNNTNIYVWFSINASTPGNYNFSIRTFNGSGVGIATLLNETNISVTVNDTTIPNNITFNSSITPRNGSFIGGNSILIDLLAYDNGAIQTLTIALFNSTGAFFNASGSNLTGAFNYTNTTTFSNISEETKLNKNFSLNISNLADRVYFLNITLNDTFNNINATMQTRTYIIDTIFPALTYVGRTDANASYVGRNHVIVEVNSTDTNFNSTNITLFNATSSAIVRSNQTFSVADFGSNSTNVALYINFTGLADGTYFYNVSGNDSAGHLNNTLLTRTVVVDTTNPLLTYGTTTDANGSYVGRNFIIVNVTATEINLNITNVTLNNVTGGANYSNLTLFNSTNPTYINFTNLLDGIYFLNVTANDTAGNRNNSFVTR